jgi:hypothetical protein
MKTNEMPSGTSAIAAKRSRLTTTGASAVRLPPPSLGPTAPSGIGQEPADPGVNLVADAPDDLDGLAGWVLKPGGRLGITDVVAEDQLSAADRAERGAWVGCIADALSKGEYQAGLAAAGFEQVSVSFTHQVGDGLHSAIVRAAKPAPAS